MRLSLVAAALIFTTHAVAQTKSIPPPPNPNPMNGESEPIAPGKCEQIDTWNRLKIWAGDCVSATRLETAPATAKKNEGKKK